MDDWFVDRVLWWQVLRPRVVILTLMDASYVDEFYDRLLWCAVILSFMVASYVVEFYDRVSGCRVRRSRAKIWSELGACQTCCDIVYIESVLEKKNLSYKIVFDLKKKLTTLLLSTWKLSQKRVVLNVIIKSEKLSSYTIGGSSRSKWASFNTGNTQNKQDHWIPAQFFISQFWTIKLQY